MAGTQHEYRIRAPLDVQFPCTAFIVSAAMLQKSKNYNVHRKVTLQRHFEGQQSLTKNRSQGERGELSFMVSPCHAK